MTHLLLSILLGTVAAAEGAADRPDCKAYVVPSSAPEQRSVHRCGEPFEPGKPDQYRVWIERPGEVSSAQGLVLYANPREETPIRMTLVPAGTVRVSRFGDAASYRLVSLAGGRFEKRVAPGQIEQMPVGDVLAGAFDAAGNAIALSKPVSVQPGRTEIASLVSPDEGSDLLVVLGKRGPRPAGDQMPALIANTRGGSRGPDASVDLGDRIVAVWYGLHGTEAKVVVTSSQWTLPAVTVPLVVKQVATYRGTIDAAK